MGQPALHLFFNAAMVEFINRHKAFTAIYVANDFAARIIDALHQSEKIILADHPQTINTGNCGGDENQVDHRQAISPLLDRLQHQQI